MTRERIIIDEIVRRSSLVFESEAHRRDFIDNTAAALARRCGDAIIPMRTESLAYSLWQPKTAALAFDRIYRIPIMDEPVPAEVGFFGATTPEIVWCAIGLFDLIAQEMGIHISGYHDAPQIASPAARERRSITQMLSELSQQYGRMPTIFFHNREARVAELTAGPREVLHTAVANISLVDESSLEWDQVLDFRKDIEATKKYRRAVRWIDNELKSRTSAEVIDDLAFRLDEYEWALRKHGISTWLGTLSSLTDPGFIGGASAAVAATSLSSSALWGALVGVSLTVGKAAISFGVTHLSTAHELRAQNYEVAYVHELKQRFGA